MAIEAAVVAILRADAGVAALVGNGDSPETFRIHPGRLPQNWASPAIRYQIVSNAPAYTLAGPAGRGRRIMQLDCYAKGGGNPWASAYALAAAVRAALAGYFGTSAGVKIHAATERDERDEPEDFAGQAYARRSVDFFFSHTE